MTELKTDVVERLQEWVGRVAEQFPQKQRVCVVDDALLTDLRTATAELTTSRATCARLQEDMQTLAAEGYYLEERVTKAEAQVATLTAELDMANEAAATWRTQLAERIVREETLTAALRRYGQHEKSCDALLSTNELHGICTCGFAAVLRAASEGAP